MAYEIPAGSVLHELDANLDMHSFPPVADLTQYDNTMPILAVKLWAGQTAYKIPASANAHIRMRKPDGKAVYDPVLGYSDDRQTVYIGVTQQMTVAAGTGNAIVEVLEGAKVIGSGRLTLSIAENPVAQAQIESNDEFLTVDELLKQAQDAAQKAQQMKEAAEAAQTKAQGNQTAAESAQHEAEGARDTAKGHADAAEGSASTAKSEQEKATQAAAAALASQTAASGSADEAARSATEAQNWTNQSKSWAIGEGDVSREPAEGIDNSKYYAGQAKTSAETASAGAKVITDNQEAIQSVHDNIEAVQGAAEAASRAEQSAGQAAADAARAQEVADKLQEIAGGDVVTSEELATAIDTHNKSEDAHSDIRSEIDADIVAHNTDPSAHHDIRTEIDADINTHNTDAEAHAAIQTKIGTDIGTHNKNTSAHSDIREEIDSDIGAHNSSNSSHSDIRTALNGKSDASHNHDTVYVKKSGDTMTGNLHVTNTSAAGWGQILVGDKVDIRTDSEGGNLRLVGANGCCFEIDCSAAGNLRVVCYKAGDPTPRILQLVSQEGVWLL